MLLNVDLNLFLYNFNNSKNDNYNKEDFLDFNFFDSCIDFFDVIAKTKIFELNLSIYIILTRHLSYKSSILKIAQKRSNYVHIFKRLALESKFLEISKFIDNDIIKNC